MRTSAAKTLVTRTPLRGMARRFVPGEGVGDLVDAVREANRAGLTTTGNYLGESVHDRANARTAAEVYVSVLDRLHEHGLEGGVSLKFTQLGQDISERFLDENLGRVLDRARDTGRFVRFDMESSEYVERTLRERFISPEGCAEIALRGLAQGLFFIPTQAYIRDDVDARYREVCAAFDALGLS